MSESKIPSAEDLLTDLHVQADYRSTVQVIHDYARAVLEAAAEVADNYDDKLQHGSGPHEVPWTVAREIASEIRRLKERL